MSPILAAGNTLARPAAQTARLRRTTKAAKTTKIAKGANVPGAKKIVANQLPAFSRQLAAMLHAGMPIVTCLEALEEQTDNPNFKTVIGRVRTSIENGASLSEAFNHFPSVFDELYVNMVRAGESGGKLPETMARLASFLEDTAKLWRKVKSAMMYPVIVICLALAITIAMLVFVVPVFGEMFQDFGAELPGPTRFLMGVSNGAKRYGILVLIGGVIAGVIFKKWRATPAGALSFDKFKLKLPVFGDLSRKVTASRFARTLGQLVRSGVPILDALEIVSGATNNEVARHVVLKARSAVEKGDPLSSAMIEQTVFPIMLVRMLQAGEKTGKVDEMMDNIADFYDDEVNTMLAGLTSLMEPLLIVFLGVFIGGIVICMFLPIFKMSEIVSI